MRKVFLTMLLTVFAAAQASASVGPPKGNVAAGEQKAQVCAACHQNAGSSSIDDHTPLLAGQYADYLERSLNQYRSGARSHAIMNGQAQGLSDEDIQDLAAYYSVQKGGPATLSSK